ncbi:MAG: hypothetical protein CFE45_37015 [Burkholderiales bacterium PBB5]|nr:MAG: hypothetical protein CFE45_37015 [Burkholderiales bacterium PBB5]
MQYLVTIHRPDDYDPSVEDEAMARDISALNAEMIAAGVRVFVGGLQSPTTARSLRPQPDGTVVMTDGAYLQAGEHVGGLWVLDVANADDALAWGRKAAVACRASVEVRPFHSRRPQAK